MFKKVFIVLFLLFVFLGKGLFCAAYAQKIRTYYVDATLGSDTNNGLSERAAWKSLSKVNGKVFPPGSRVLFKRGEKWQGQLVPQGSGTAHKPIVFSAYGTGELPAIEAAGKYKDAVLLKNISNIVVEYLDLSNFDASVKEQKTGPTGVRILAENIGTISNIRLANLYIHDINGDNKKGSKEGHGIFWDCQGPAKSNIENLVIEYCKVERVDRNGIRGNGTFSDRDNWFPNRNLVIRHCYINDIGGDGIVVKAFDGALVEHNKLYYTRVRARDNGVAVWPHSSDNTIIQYNEVAFTKNDNWANDSQSFDIDGNCRNTTIQYNYSHDNDGGFMLVISDAINEKSTMTANNVIRYNLSVNDGVVRKRLFNLVGRTDSTEIYGNVFYNDSPVADTMEVIDMEHGLPKNVSFRDNVFYFASKNAGVFTKSREQYEALNWSGNVFSGNISGVEQLLNATGNKTAIEESRPLEGYPFNYLPRVFFNNTATE